MFSVTSQWHSFNSISKAGEREREDKVVTWWARQNFDWTYKILACLFCLSRKYVIGFSPRPGDAKLRCASGGRGFNPTALEKFTAAPVLKKIWHRKPFQKKKHYKVFFWQKPKKIFLASDRVDYFQFTIIWPLNCAKRWSLFYMKASQHSQKANQTFWPLSLIASFKRCKTNGETAQSNWKKLQQKFCKTFWRTALAVKMDLAHLWPLHTVLVYSFFYAVSLLIYCTHIHIHTLLRSLILFIL